MSTQYLKYGALISPLGATADAHFDAFSKGNSGIKTSSKAGFNQEDICLSKIDFLTGNRFDNLLEKACDTFIEENDTAYLKSNRTLVIVSTTKANIAALPGDTFASIRSILSAKMQIVNEPLIVSNACISGVAAILTASDYISAGLYDDVVIIGIDCLSDFVVYGFQSLFAISQEPCKPFDSSRKGISLGEACGIIVLSNHPENASLTVEYAGGAISNDANHISGPSRTGEGLYRAVKRTLDRTNTKAEQIDFISAHGTGTIFNDDMESIAFNRLELEKCPLNSMKGYFGHTLGAAGVIETLMSMLSIDRQVLFKSAGFETAGTKEKINVLLNHQSAEVHCVLKTASGFGGGNAAILLKKH